MLSPLYWARDSSAPPGALELPVHPHVSLIHQPQIFLVTVLSPLYWGVAFCAFWLLRGLALRRRGQLLGGRALAGYVRRRSILTMNCVIFIQ